MITNQEILFEYWNLCQKILKDYHLHLSKELQKNGYNVRELYNYVYLIGKKKGNIISLSNPKKKLPYGNIMPENLDLILPFNQESLKKENIEKTESRLEKIAKTISNNKLVDFAFENEIAVSIIGKKFEYNQLENSIGIPFEAADNGSNLLAYMEECMQQKKGFFRRIRELF